MLSKFHCFIQHEENYGQWELVEEFLFHNTNILKVSYFLNVFSVFSILPKNQFYFTTKKIKANCFRLLFGRIEDTKETFLN